MNLLKQDASQPKRRNRDSAESLCEGQAHIPFCIVQNTRIRYANTPFFRMIGRDRRALAEVGFSTLFGPEDKERALRCVSVPPAENSFLPGTSCTGKLLSGEDRVPVRMYFFPVRFQGDVASIVLFHDDSRYLKAVRRAREYERQIRRLGAELISSEERQRRQLATELHDGITQSLAIMRMQLGALLQDPETSTLQERLEELRSLVDETIGETRRMVFELSPPVLYGLSLEHVLRDMTEEFQHRYPLTLSFLWTGSEPSIEDDLQMFLYRILRELLMNVVKHARANHVSVVCSLVDDNFILDVSDDGIGFPDNESRGNRGFGLQSIRERVTSLGGTIHINSCPGNGTSIRVELPVGTGAETGNSIK